MVTTTQQPNDALASAGRYGVGDTIALKPRTRALSGPLELARPGTARPARARA